MFMIFYSTTFKMFTIRFILLVKNEKFKFKHDLFYYPKYNEKLNSPWKHTYYNNNKVQSAYNNRLKLNITITRTVGVKCITKKPLQI